MPVAFLLLVAVAAVGVGVAMTLKGAGLPSELLESATAEANGIDNTPPPRALAKLRRTHAVVLEVFGDTVRPTSGYRNQETCDAVNRSIGRLSRIGAFSYHQTGESEDIVPAEGSGLTMPSITRKAKQSGKFSYVLDEGNHVHVEVRQTDA